MLDNRDAGYVRADTLYSWIGRLWMDIGYGCHILGYDAIFLSSQSLDIIIVWIGQAMDAIFLDRRAMDAIFLNRRAMDAIFLPYSSIGGLWMPYSWIGQAMDAIFQAMDAI